MCGAWALQNNTVLKEILRHAVYQPSLKIHAALKQAEAPLSFAGIKWSIFGGVA